MKSLCLIPVLLVFYSALSAQDSLYKHSYNFRLDPIACDEKVSIDSQNTKDYAPVLQVIAKGCDGSKAGFATLIVQGIDRITTVADTNGKATIALKKPGVYTLTVAAPGYIDFSRTISATAMYNTSISINLMRSPSLIIYEIHSKIPLDEKKIDRIKKCATSKKDLLACAEPGVYYVMMQI